MWLPNGNTEKRDVETFPVFGPYFFKVFLVNLPVDWPALDGEIQRNVMHKLDRPISRDKLKAEVKKLTNYKLLGPNKIPPNSLKALNNENLNHLLDLFNK